MLSHRNSLTRFSCTASIASYYQFCPLQSHNQILWLQPHQSPKRSHTVGCPLILRRHLVALSVHPHPLHVLPVPRSVAMSSALPGLLCRCGSPRLSSSGLGSSGVMEPDIPRGFRLVACHGCTIRFLEERCGVGVARSHCIRKRRLPLGLPPHCTDLPAICRHSTACLPHTPNRQSSHRHS